MTGRSAPERPTSTDAGARSAEGSGSTQSTGAALATTRGAGAVDGFRADSTGERWVCGGPITVENAGPVLEASRTLALPRSGIVDCDALHPVDSSAVAVLLALKRRALEEKVALSFVNITPSLHTLSDLYGVEELLVS
ncbi:MAG: STAS domain-containing protein [Pseudomonadota bacterium]|nr:STAS domain-containing protein [Pseudomonadota bacterium]